MYITPRKALKIQADQVKRLHSHIHGISEIVASRTNTLGINLDEPMHEREVNKRIPRGWRIDFIIATL